MNDTWTVSVADPAQDQRDNYERLRISNADEEAMRFEAFPKIPRFRDMIISEKIDGTNAAIGVRQCAFGEHVDGVPDGTKLVLGPNDGEDGLPDVEYLVWAQSRKRPIKPGKGNDNFGFAQWVHDNARALALALGQGKHFGEWWGQGIQRGYQMDHKRFSLFNTDRNAWLAESVKRLEFEREFNENLSTLDVVPVLSRFVFSMEEIDFQLSTLEDLGSLAARLHGRDGVPAEGVVVFLPQARLMFKKTLGGDGGKYAS